MSFGQLMIFSKELKEKNEKIAELEEENKLLKALNTEARLKNTRTASTAQPSGKRSLRLSTNRPNYNAKPQHNMNRFSE